MASEATAMEDIQDDEEMNADSNAENVNAEEEASDDENSGSAQGDDGAESSSEEESDDNEASSSSSEDDNDDDDGSDDEQTGNNGNPENAAGGQGLSDYERLRLERIKRNKDRLIALGLESKDNDGGFLGKKTPKRRKSVSNNDNASAGPKRRSSRSTGNVDYTEPSISIAKLMKAEKDSANANPSASQDGEEKPPKHTARPRMESKTAHRMPRFIYDEFQFISSHKKRMIKLAGKNLKSAEKEVSFWQKKAEKEEKRVQQEMENERILKHLEEEKQIYGGSSSREFLQQIDQRTPEIIQKMRQYDYTRLNEEERVETEARRLENENKLKLLDALDAYPTACLQSVKILNTFLTQRAPKDPPPPRRSKRQTEEESSESAKPPAKKTKGGGQTKDPGMSERIEQLVHSGGISSAATQASLTQVETVLAQPPEGSPENPDGTKSKQKRELHVGGWVSPLFSATIDRSWLEKDSSHKRFDLKTFVAQPGDTVLYYPAGHRDFLKKHPDHLFRKKISRMPLWERAKKEKLKGSKTQTKTDEKDEKDSPADGAQPPLSTPRTWWNDEWISEVEASLGNYPIVCRVEKAQAEFPPDPFAHHKVVGSDGQIGWTLPDAAAKAKAKKKAVLRLAVTLRPLTNVMPPTWTESGPVEKHSLVPPPAFTVVTFPCQLQPFLVPLAWGYLSYHSLSVDDDVVIAHSKAGQKGKIRSFAALDGDFGSCRLDDKVGLITTMLGQWNKEDSSTKDSIPPQDALIIREFLTSFLSTHDFPNEAKSIEPTTHNSHFTDFLRCTLPLWNGVSGDRDLYDRRTFWQFWDVKARNALLNRENAGMEALRVFMEFGLARSLDSALRVKIECTIEDFLRENTAAGPFRPTVTDEMAPAYSNAVPISMSFDRVLLRLKDKGSSTGGAQCWYRSFDSFLSDLNAIQDNCALYNSPDSVLVQSVNEMIPTAKKSLSTVATRHVRDRAEKLKAENEKREFVMMTCNSEALVKSDGLADKAGEADKKSKAVDPFKEPFKGPLYRDWLQLTLPDVSWHQNQHSFSQWVPQAGDRILYSRKLHAEFVKGHYDALATNQCVLPQFKRSEGQVLTAESDSSKKNSSDGKSADALQSGWIAGTIISMQAGFPRPRKSSVKSSGDDKGSFFVDTAVLAITLRCSGYDSGEGNTKSVVHWRPCMFTRDLSDGSKWSTECCPCCGVQLATSFVRPSWVDQFGQKVEDDSNLSSSSTEPSSREPLGLPREEAPAIERALSLLKRRCMNKVAADYVDPNLTTQRVKQGYVPPQAKVGANSLPDFEELLRIDAETGDSTKTMATRVVPKEADASIPDLVKWNFLPPWLPQSTMDDSQKDDSPALHESLSPWPNLSLELVFVRLRNGYYRQREAIAQDIIEAYVTTVLLLLAPLSIRKKNPISIKKMTNVLASRKYSVASMGAKRTKKKPDKAPGAVDPNSKKASKDAGKSKLKKSPTKPKKSPNKGKPTKAKATKKPAKSLVQKAKTQGSKKAKSKEMTVSAPPATLSANSSQLHVATTKPKKQVSPQRNANLSEEEMEIVARLEMVRRLYAAALVCMSEIKHVNYLYGLTPLVVSRQNLRQNMMTFSIGKAQAVHAHGVLTTLLAATGRDMCINRHQKTSQERPCVQVKLIVAGEPVKFEETVVIGGSSKPASVAAAPGKGENQAEPEPEVRDPGKSIVVVRDGVRFNLSDYEKHAHLIKLFFGKPGRTKPCARCTASRKGMLYCRVIKHHSNVDFCLKSFASIGGLQALFQIMLQQPKLHTVAAQSEQPGGTAQASSSADHKAEGEKTEAASSVPNPLKSTNDGNSGMDSAATQSNSPSGDASTDKKMQGENTEDKTAQSTNDGKTAETTTDLQSVSQDIEGEKTENVSGSKTIVDSTSGKSPNDQPDSGTTGAKAGEGNKDAKNSVDPRLLCRKALSALVVAKELLASAKAYSDAPARLTDEFIACNFPFDTSDGHYAFCIICGLSGDLLCCDGCANVVHPKCAKIGTIPEGDWFCGHCIAQKKASSDGDKDKDDVMNEATKSGDTKKGGLETDDLTADAPDANESSGNEPVVSDSHLPSSSEAPAAPNLASGSDGADLALVTDKKGSTIDSNSPVSARTQLVSEVDAQQQKENGSSNSTDEPVELSKVENEAAGAEAASDVGARIPPVVDFDEDKATALSSELDNLFFHRTGRQRGLKSEDSKEKKKNSKKDLDDDKEKELRVAETSPEDDAIHVGILFLKKFGRYGYFQGEVKALPNDNHPFFRVLYEDGDEEDLSEKQLIRFVNSAPSIKMRKKKKREEKTKGDPAGEPKKKRGRPRKSDGDVDKQASSTSDAMPDEKEKKIPPSFEAAEDDGEPKDIGTAKKLARKGKRPLGEVEDDNSADGKSAEAKKAKLGSPPGNE